MSVGFSCDCGKSLHVSEDKRGKRIKCPACGEVLRVPDIDDAEEEFTEEAVPRVQAGKSRKKTTKAKKGASVSLLVVGGGLGLIAVMAVGAMLFWPRTSNKVPVAQTTDWQSFQHRVGGFSVEVPNALQKIPTREAGDDFYAIRIAGEHPYTVHVNCYIFAKGTTAAKPVPMLLARAAELIADGRNIQQQSNIRHNGHQGLDFLVAGPKGNQRSRLFLHHNVVIELAVTWEKQEPTTERDRFWNSIQFTRQGGRGGSKSPAME
jgi:hypothetical protein